MQRSWKTTFTALSQLQGPIELADHALQEHLTSPHVFQLLSKPFAPFSAPTPQTKSSLETKTSAINVSPNPQGRYDIKQIQDDTKWLSKETNIDEIAALRIAVLEWQSRPASLLLQGNYAEIAPNVKPALGGKLLDLNGSQSFRHTRGFPLRNQNTKSSDDAGARRIRLLEIYLTERRYIIKSCEHVVFVALCQLASQDGKLSSPLSSDWMGKLGSDIIAAWSLQEGVDGTNKDFFITSVEALQSRVLGLEQGSGWFKDDFREELEQAWARNQLLEMIDILRIMLLLLESSADLTRSDAILAWFRFMEASGFFEIFEPVNFTPSEVTSDC